MPTITPTYVWQYERSSMFHVTAGDDYWINAAATNNLDPHQAKKFPNTLLLHSGNLPEADAAAQKRIGVHLLQATVHYAVTRQATLQQPELSAVRAINFPKLALVHAMIDVFSIDQMQISLNGSDETYGRDAPKPLEGYVLPTHTNAIDAVDTLFSSHIAEAWPSPEVILKR